MPLKKALRGRDYAWQTVAGEGHVDPQPGRTNVRKEPFPPVFGDTRIECPFTEAVKSWNERKLPLAIATVAMLTPFQG